jgi:hypothetical protein
MTYGQGRLISNIGPGSALRITILSCLDKLFIAILNNRLKTYSESFLLLNENQCGFRKGYSTLDYIYIIHAFLKGEHF